MVHLATLEPFRSNWRQTLRTPYTLTLAVSPASAGHPAVPAGCVFLDAGGAADAGNALTG